MATTNGNTAAMQILFLGLFLFTALESACSRAHLEKLPELVPHSQDKGNLGRSLSAGAPVRCEPQRAEGSTRTRLYPGRI